jgi:lipopolysaccharide transport system ATP-binding protein
MQEVLALKEISFEIKRGETIGIIGRNGSGKSTLLEIVTGTLTPTSGSVKVHGRVSALLELGSGFDPEYSGRDNVVLNGLLLGLSKDEILNRFSEIEAFADIGVSIDRAVKTYSTGMMVRLAFAVQVLCDPDILIIDEALSVGDFFFQQKCFSYIQKLREKGVTLIFVSHDLGSVRSLCSRVLYLKSGTLQFDGDSLNAITEFLKEDVQRRSTGVIEKPQSNSQYSYVAAELWNSGVQQTGKLYSISIRNSSNEACTSFRIGERAIISVLYIPDPFVPSHITIGFLNRHNQLITATGSMQLGNLPLGMRGDSKLQCYELEIELMMEAGGYSFEVTLGYETKINHGDRLDKSPPLGPINILWNYEKDWAPFIGLVGLPSKGKFKLSNSEGAIE